MIHSARVHVVRMRVRSYKESPRKSDWRLQNFCKPYIMFWDCPDKTK